MYYIRVWYKDQDGQVSHEDTEYPEVCEIMKCTPFDAEIVTDKDMKYKDKNKLYRIYDSSLDKKKAKEISEFKELINKTKKLNKLKHDPVIDKNGNCDFDCSECNFFDINIPHDSYSLSDCCTRYVNEKARKIRAIHTF